MPNHFCSRRVALKVLAAGGAAGTLASACSGPAGATPDSVGVVQAGLVSSYPVGSLEPVGNLALAVGRDAKGLYAMTLTCTHAGCNMAVDGDVSASGIVCSGTMSPTLGIPIGTAYLPVEGAKEGTTFEIEIRGNRVPATVTKPPFYKNASHL